MTQNQGDDDHQERAGSADIAAALGNPGEVMRHVGMWIGHSERMVAPVMEAIAQRAPEEFLKNVDSLVGVLAERDIKAWLQLAIHALVHRGQHKLVLQYARVPQKYFGNGATAVIMSMAARSVPPRHVFDAQFLREMKAWGFIDGEICLVLQAAVSAAAAEDWGRQRILVDDILGAGSSDRVFCVSGRAEAPPTPAKTGEQIVRELEDLVESNPKVVLDGVVANSAALSAEDVSRLLQGLSARVPLEDIFDSRLLTVVQDKKMGDAEVLALLGEAINAVSADDSLPLRDILFFSPAWTPFLSPGVIAGVVRLLNLKVPQEVVWFKENLAACLSDQDRREIFGTDDDDSHLERAYGHRDGVQPVREKIIASVVRGLSAMDEVGGELASRLQTLATDSTPTSVDNKKIVGGRINAVVGIDHSHAGGMGISIQWDDDRKALQRALVHECIAGNILGDPQTVHGLADAVAYAVVDGDAKDRAEAKTRLNHLAAEGLRLSPKALWQMTQAERDHLRDNRDFACRDAIRRPRWWRRGSCGWRRRIRSTNP